MKFYSKWLILFLIVLCSKNLSAGFVTDKLGVGTANPTEVEVIGTVKASSFTMITGASDGYILTTDASGNGTWQTASFPDPALLINSTNTWTAANTWLSSSTFNQNSLDKDFRIKGQTDANLFFADASANRIGIGTDSPVEKLTVNGRLAIAEGDQCVPYSGYGNLCVDNVNKQLSHMEALGSIELITPSYAIFQEQQPSGTSGGGFSAGSWVQRTLNTTIASRGTSITRSGSDIILSSGTYQVMIEAPAYRVNLHQTRFYNVTDGATAFSGSSEYSRSSAVGDSTPSLLHGAVVITDQKTFRIEHRCGTANATDGFGNASGFGETEVYTYCFIQRCK
ncbi:hypothetical protein ACFL58_00890 [Elusimicrobiota bacterium]